MHTVYAPHHTSRQQSHLITLFPLIWHAETINEGEVHITNVI